MRGFSFPIFFSCYNLKSVTIPEGVTHISYLTFNDCRSLATVNLPKTLTFSGVSSFEGCISLKSIEIPATVIKISKDAFKDVSLKRLKLGWTSPKTFDYEVFPNPEETELYVPKGCVDLYQKSDYWKRFKKIIPY